MSASLVGSEMCIRDRFCEGEAGDGRHGIQKGRKRIAVWVVVCSFLSTRACLLYTSDAADDM
eukprot:688475-Alexandrium_andersonii.AAC.1